MRVQVTDNKRLCSSESSGFSFRLQKSEDVALTHGALDVSHESSVSSANKCNFNLCNTSSGACTVSSIKAYQFCR